MSTVDADYLELDQLRIGQYVYIDLKWFEHPFAFSHFKIKSEAQIEAIRSVGLKRVRFSPELSDGNLAPLHVAAQPAAKVAPVQDSISPIMLAKRAMIAQMQLNRQNAARIEKAFVSTANAIRDIEKHIYSRPQETVAQANVLINEIVDAILVAPELAIHVMGDKMGGEELYFHSLNVTMLSIMMARDLKLPVEVVGVLGIGALMHDIGRKEVPDKIWHKTGALTQAERHFYELHCQYGEDIGRRMQLAPAAVAIIKEHHEFFDGSGYPAHAKGDSISLLSRIVVIANHYDELCNPPLIADALTPHETLSLMFAKFRGKFDPQLLQVFIRCLGVYPPGTIVQLSNGALGMVTTVNTARPMKPMVMVYDAEVPKEEAIVLNMAHETEFNIAKAIRPAHVPREVYNYLSPRKRISYYFDAVPGRPAQAKT